MKNCLFTSSIRKYHRKTIQRKRCDNEAMMEELLNWTSVAATKMKTHHYTGSRQFIIKQPNLKTRMHISGRNGLGKESLHTLVDIVWRYNHTTVLWL